MAEPYLHSEQEGKGADIQGDLEAHKRGARPRVKHRTHIGILQPVVNPGRQTRFQHHQYSGVANNIQNKHKTTLRSFHTNRGGARVRTRSVVPSPYQTCGSEPVAKVGVRARASGGIPRRHFRPHTAIPRSRNEPHYSQQAEHGRNAHGRENSFTRYTDADQGGVLPRTRGGTSRRYPRRHTTVPRNQNESQHIQHSDEKSEKRGVKRNPVRGPRGLHSGRQTTITKRQSHLCNQPGRRDNSQQETGTHPMERRIRGLGFPKLRELNEKNPSEILYTIANQKSGFVPHLQSENIKSDVIVMILAIMAKALSCNKDGSLFYFLNILNSSNFLTKPFVAFLLTSLAAKTCIRHRYGRPIKDALTIMKSVLEARCPGSYVKFVPTITTLQHVLRTHGDSLQDTETRELMCEVIAARDAAREHEVQIVAASGKLQNKDVEPPNDFRHIPILPTVKEIQTKENPFLRPNIAEGDYTNLQHYLDVQYRLFREDFVAPLREGISEYIESLQHVDSNQRLQDIRLYRDVHVLKTIYQEDGIAHLIQFSLQGLKRVAWDVSKRLMFGSLLCLSNDDFKHIYYATVCDRQPKELAKGLVRACLITENNQDIDIPRDQTFVMAESMAFFQAYEPVLQGLRGMEENDLPFENYILKCQQEPEIPIYLKKKDQEIVYDLSVIVADMVGVTEKEECQLKTVSILAADKLPKCDTLGMDPSQMRALHAALTNKFALIQGPPGTGKTYVGLKIVKTLLHNERYWQQVSRKTEADCILLVCYTNHALDQFLEGILEFQIDNIIRVGGRSKSEKLEEYNLKNIRRHSRPGEAESSRERACRDAYGNVKCIQDTLERAEEDLIKSERAILPEDVLGPYMLTSHYDELFPDGWLRKPSQEYICAWLSDLQDEYNDNSLTVATEEKEETPHGELDNKCNDIENSKTDDQIDIEGEAAFTAEQRMLDDDIFEDEKAVWKNKQKDKNVHPAQENKEYEWQYQRSGKRMLVQNCYRELRSTDVMSEEELSEIDTIWALDIKDKWRLYRHWIHKHRLDMMQHIKRLTDQFQLVVNHLRELRSDRDLALLSDAKVIGMTTTGAAKHRKILQQLKPKIVIVEEAAEVLEAHIITSLTSNCQHLILIGDHLQLRPSPSVYRLAKDYKLEISLFERMVGNGIPCQTLENQHRMRPEISNVLHHIYPQLQDDRSVMDYENIRGVSRNIFYVSHKFLESHNEETKSKSNQHEASFITALCLYLLKQGYEPSQITILTPYTGQLLLFKTRMPKTVFNGVRVCAIDNYQGEENDIILLSLVRSNDENKIGFLGEANRVCVALSRARKGFYVIGNFDLLFKKNALWNKLVKTLKQQEAIGDCLKLYCPNHPEDGETSVTIAKDFDMVPEGGCIKPCDYRMSCGHVCILKCHPYDQEHKHVRCNKPCEKSPCSQGHLCPKACYEDCGDCTTRVWKIVPNCKHTQNIPCYMSPDEYICQAPCEEFLSCGHSCTNKCGEPHTKNCSVPITHTRACDHKANIQCYQRNEPCLEPCQSLLICGHSCSGSCRKCLRGRLHAPCNELCTRRLVCGHRCQKTCSSDCLPCSESCENSCVHSMCTKKCGDPCDVCKKPCPWRCRHYKCTKLCHESCDRPRCDKPCGMNLRCGHRCMGLCGEKCPKYCGACSKVQMFGKRSQLIELEDCHHIFEVSKLDLWMDKTETNENGHQSIQPRTCPKCKTAVRRTPRYGTIIKRMRCDIEQIKAPVYGDSQEIESRKSRIKQRLQINARLPKVYHDVIVKMHHIYLGQLVCMENAINFAEELGAIEKRITDFGPISESVLRDINLLFLWLSQYRYKISGQELKDWQMELSRIRLLRKSYLFKNAMIDSQDTLGRYSQILDLVISVMTDGTPLTQIKQDNVEYHLKTIERILPRSALVDVFDLEPQQIIQNRLLNKGNWFKCHNNHFYTSGDCVEVAQRVKCLECQTPSGGGN